MPFGPASTLVQYLESAAVSESAYTIVLFGRLILGSLSMDVLRMSRYDSRVLLRSSPTIGP